ncbi:phist protein [Plasmodium cynomolgi strain B]|uniref:Phist protein n=1 Tax=Plasmodium cynomolgi (strain B) TaxID=1120755 RepID=K6V8A0_PLACD|nr:phist protein [Plasmodium cynomolgi strain B]GAB65377.1 phist protein [Plasmodium cynomolgi strain B]
MGVRLSFTIPGLLNVLLVSFMFLLVHQEKGLNEQPLSTKEACIECSQKRKLAASPPRRTINDEIDEEDEAAGPSRGSRSSSRRSSSSSSSSSSSNRRQGNVSNMDEHYGLNNGQAERTKNENAIDYVHNDIEETYELPDYDTIKEKERRRKEDYDNNSYEMNENEFIRSISEDEVNERIKRLGESVDVKEMFIIWNYVNGFERTKYINMENNIIEYCENLASAYNVSRKTKAEQWIKVYYYMKDELFYKERKFYKKLYNFLEHGPSSKKLFLEFLNQTKLSWRNFRRDVNSICMEMLNSTLTGF